MALGGHDPVQDIMAGDVGDEVPLPVDLLKVSSAFLRSVMSTLVVMTCPFQGDGSDQIVSAIGTMVFSLGDRPFRRPHPPHHVQGLGLHLRGGLSLYALPFNCSMELAP